MPRLILTEGAVIGIERCRLFLTEGNPAAATRAAREIVRSLRLVTTRSSIGRPAGDDADVHELVIRFGGSGYVALYRHDNAADAVIVLAFRHQREAGY